MVRFLLLPLLVVTQLGFISTPTHLPHQQTDSTVEFDQYIQQAMESFGIPGAYVVMIDQGEVIYSQGFGVTSIESPQPITADTRFMIGSTTKIFTASLAATLVQAGQFAWDSPIQPLFPEVTLSSEIQLQHLLSNTSGIPRFDLPLLLQTQSPSEVVADIAALPLVSAPDEAFLYSNHGVTLAGYAIAATAGYPDWQAGYLGLMQSKMFDPLGMNHTTFDFDLAVQDATHAFPHQYQPESHTITPAPLEDERFVLPVLPAGGMWSTANDLTHFAQAILNGDSPLSAETLAEMWTPRISLPDQRQYGLGWFVDEDYHGGLKVDHAGNTAAFTSSFTLLPEAQQAVIVLVNRDRANAFATAITDYGFESMLGLDHAPMEAYLAQQTALYQALPPMATGPIDPQTAQAYVGDYERHLTVVLDSVTGEMSLQTEMGNFPMVTLPDLGEGFYGIQARTLLAARFTTLADGITQLEMRHPVAGLPLIVTRLE